MEKYDVIIIGAGIGGLMCAYRLKEKSPKLKVLILEKGEKLSKRSCPMKEKKLDKCCGCADCAIMNGVAGAGAFSDGKFIIGTEYGGWLPNYLDHTLTMEYINGLDAILRSFAAGEDIPYYEPSNELKAKCLSYDLHLLQVRVVHFGTNGNLKIMTRLVEDIEKSIELRTNTAVTKISFADKQLCTDRGETLSYDRLVIASGRSGAIWFEEMCRENKVEVKSNQVDIGVRVELPRIIWEDISRKIYEPKILYRTKQYGDITRMFCFNSGGEVVMENTGGVLTVNGHANAGEQFKTQNSNFAILSTINFTSPFDAPIEYAQHVAKLGNMISGGGVLVQRFGDLMNGRRTQEKRLAQSTVRPTLNAVPGDLSLCIPKRQLDNIIETIQVLDKVAPGTANYDTLLYGVEAKYYSARPKFIDDKFRIADSVFAIGDGSGVTRSLSQAGAMGMLVGDVIAAETQN